MRNTGIQPEKAGAGERDGNGKKRGGYAKQFSVAFSVEQHVMLTLPRPIWFRHIKIFAISPVPGPVTVPDIVVVNILGLVGAYRV